MRYRSTIIYLVAVILLVGLYLYETRTGEREEKAREEAKLLLQVQSDQLESITLKRENGLIKLEKSRAADQEAWVIRSPVRTGADEVEVNQLKDRLVGLKYSRVISENTDELAKFGLENPVSVISYTAGEKEGLISFGSKTPLGDGFYARRGEERTIYLISDIQKQDLDRTLFDLRDKRLFTLETERINRMVIDRESVKWVLLKKAGTWFFEGDEAFGVDQNKVESMIRRTTWGKASSFEKEHTEDLKPYGLDRPKARIILSDDKRGEEMILGNHARDDKKGTIYAKMKAKPQVLTVRKKLLEDLPQSKNELKGKESH